MSRKKFHNTHQTQNKKREKRKAQRKLILKCFYKIAGFILRHFLFDDFFDDLSK